MKTLAALMGLIAPATSYAATGTPAGDDGIFVWIFLGFFAVIVVGQLIPAVILIIGAVKGIRSKVEMKNEGR